MRIGKSTLVAGSVVAIALALAITALAGTVSSGGVTLTFPEYPLSGPGLASCEPWEEPTANTVTVTGAPAGSTVSFQFVWGSPSGGTLNFLSPVTYASTGDPLIVPVSYPLDSSQWPLWDQTTNERAISVGVFVRVTRPDGTLVKLAAKQWWVRCLPPPPPSEGCTPGYWKQEQHLDSWVPTGYAPGDDFEVVFGVNASFDPDTLLDAVSLGGGGENALARHAVAALLNASHPDIGASYAYTAAQVIQGVQSAYASGDFEPFKDALDLANNAGCPLN